MNGMLNIGIDLGGTNIRGGLVIEKDLQYFLSKKINAAGSIEEVLVELFSLTDMLITPAVKSIGIGVP